MGMHHILSSGTAEMADSNWQPRETMRLIYRPWDTNVGQDVYVCVQYFREEYPEQEQIPVSRQSTPYVLYRRLGSRTVVPGSVCESLGNLGVQLDELMMSLRDRVPISTKATAKSASRCIGNMTGI